jgi:hypothetical protein
MCKYTLPLRDSAGLSPDFLIVGICLWRRDAPQRAFRLFIGASLAEGGGRVKWWVKGLAQRRKGPGRVSRKGAKVRTEDGVSQRSPVLMTVAAGGGDASSQFAGFGCGFMRMD